jgi:undecaprenyl-diphosphatase
LIFVAVFIAVFLALWGVFLVLHPLSHVLLRRTAHWTASFRYGDYLPVAIALAAGMAITTIAAEGFLDLAELLQAKNPELEEVDSTMHARARTMRSPGATSFFTVVTQIGSPVGLGCIVLAVSIALVMGRRWRWLAYLLVTAFIGSLLNMGLKLYYARARPDLMEAVRHASGYSFPSGHAMGAAIVFGALSYLATRALPHRQARAAALAFFTAMILAVAASRIYLGVHWISDVAAGIGAGLLWVTVTTVAYETSRRVRMVRALRRERKSGPSS